MDHSVKCKGSRYREIGKRKRGMEAKDLVIFKKETKMSGLFYIIIMTSKGNPRII